MDEHDRPPPVEKSHKRIECRIAQVEAPMIGLDSDAIRSELIQRVDRLADRARHIGQRQGGEQSEPSAPRADEFGALLVHRTRQLAGSVVVAKMHTGRGDRQHRGADRQGVHQLERLRLAPLGQGGHTVGVLLSCGERRLAIIVG